VKRPFEASPEELAADLESYVDAVYANLTSSFLVLPKGNAFVEYPRFQEAYEVLKGATRSFEDFTPERVWSALAQDGLVLLVVRTILGMTPPEWAELVNAETDVKIDQGAARSLDQRARTDPASISRAALKSAGVTTQRLRAMVAMACRYSTAGAPPAAEDTVHRLNKVDTSEGVTSLRSVARLGVPYAVLLYERYLGRPFASHRDGVSELVGDVMESAIEARLDAADVSCRKTKRAERIPGFAQAPDFFVPDEFAPAAVIEAKITNDDGTARDKFSRLHRLVQMSQQAKARGERGFQVIACIDGRGFGIRREDMRQLLVAVEGKVFTLNTLDQLIPYTELARFARKPQ
jgi:hypothetical protein